MPVPFGCRSGQALSKVEGTPKSLYEDHRNSRAEARGRWDKTKKVRLRSSLRLRVSARVDSVAGGEPAVPMMKIRARRSQKTVAGSQ